MPRTDNLGEADARKSRNFVFTLVIHRPCEIFAQFWFVIYG